MDDIVCRQCGTLNDYHVIEKGVQHTAFCNSCGAYIKNIPYATKLCLYFGRYKEVDLNDFNTPDHISYLRWCKNTPDLWVKLKPKIKDKINSLLNEK